MNRTKASFARTNIQLMHKYNNRVHDKGCQDLPDRMFCFAGVAIAAFGC